MAKDLTPVRIPQFEGGLNLAEKSIIPDNALSVATNVFYNSDKKLQTRRGQRAFGNPVPDAAKIIHNCDSTSANGTWSASDDAVSLAADATTVKRGSASLKFNITVATSVNDYATIANSTLTAVDITTVKGYLGMWIFVPTGGKTNLTDCRLRIGSSAANYYEFTINPSDLTENAWVFVRKPFSGATTTGTPTDASITYLFFRVNYSASYTDKTNWRIDDIACYSSTSSKAMMSIKYFKSNASTPARYLLTNVGTTLYEYDETSSNWTVVKTGLTEGTRFSMAAYKNIMYFTNGVDNYFSYNGTSTTEHTGANTYKGKYLLLANDIGYILGDPSVPSTVGYTAATPANLQTFPNALVLDEDDSSGKGTGLMNLGPVVIAGKNKKIYKINVATPSREQLDYSNGLLGNRAFVRVENEVFFMNESGVYTLAQREATTGSLRSDPLSSDIQSLTDSISGTYLENAAGFYNSKLRNVYFWVDTNADGLNDTALLFSVLTKKWTKYTGINANEAVIWENSSGNEYFLIANALGGQCREIEYGTNDNGNEISNEIQSKNFDFDIPETKKTFEMVEIFGFISESAELQFNAIIDDSTTTSTKVIRGTSFVNSSAAINYALGAQVLGTAALGGDSTAASVTLYPFKARIAMNITGNRIRLKVFSLKKNSVWILSKASIYPYPQPLDFFEYNLIY